MSELGTFVSGVSYDQTSLNFSFTKDQNLTAFGTGSGAQRYYQLFFNVKNNNAQNDVIATIYHIPASISEVVTYDYFNTDDYSNQITFLLNFSENFNYFIPRAVNVYTGTQIGNAYDLS